MRERDKVFWVVRRHALRALRAGELSAAPLPDGITAVAVWHDERSGAVLFHAQPGAQLFSFDSIESLRFEIGEFRPLLRRWKWAGACGFGLSDGVPGPPADGLKVLGGSDGSTLNLCCGRAGADVAGLQVGTDDRQSLVPIGPDGFFVLGRRREDAPVLARGLDRDGRELSAAVLSF